MKQQAVGEQYPTKAQYGQDPRLTGQQQPTEFHTYESPSGQDLSILSEDDPANQRYVAGGQFYNYEMYGSLRKGGAVAFYSMECLGLLAATYSSAFSYQTLVGVARPLMSQQLTLTKEQNTAVNRLIQLPMALSVVVGLISDCYPIMGLRRKGYMIVGLIINAISVLSLAALSAKFESQPKEERSDVLMLMAIIFVGLASLGCIITYMCVHTRIIELSQRESLRNRGTIQADYLIFRRYTSITSATFNYLTMGTGSTPNISFSSAMLLLALICVLPTPVIIRYWREEHYSLPTTLKIRAQIFWKIMQQKAVWRILMFIIFFQVFLSITFSDSTRVVTGWADAAKDNSLLLATIRDVVMIITIWTWKKFFMNSLWRGYFAWAPITQVVPLLLAGILVCFDLYRDRYFYRFLQCIPYISDGITTLNLVVPLTEIIQEGSEGATVGLTLSLQRVTSTFVSTNAGALFKGSNFYDTDAAKTYSSDVATDVFLSLLLSYGINCIAFFGLIFLPSQKLDAQQLRMYGGFTKAASSIIVVASAVLLLYSMVINIMTFVPSLSCFEIAGGGGC